MSFAMNDVQQLSFDDSLYHLTDREKRILDNSWAKDFEDSEYQLLLRVIREQTTTSKEGQYQLKEKGNGSMGSDILQNPSDPDATYCKKAGKENRRYIANITEDVNENGSVISEYQYEQNTHSDSQFIKEYFSGMEPQSESTILVTDGGFSGNDNMEAAKEKNSLTSSAVFSLHDIP